MATQNPITVTSGQFLVDTSIIPFIRKNDVEFAAGDLKPYKTANFFFDETDVSRFVQNPSVLTASETTDLGLSRGNKLYNLTTKAYASVVDASPNNTISLNEDYLTVNIAGVLLTSSSYARGDVVYQNGTATGAANADSNTFMARVEYWDVANTILILTPQHGTLNYASGVGNTLFKVPSTSATSNVRSVVGATPSARFASGQTVVNLDAPATTLTVATYQHYSGQVLVVDGATSTINVTSNLINTGVGSGNLIRITSGTGLGQLRSISSIDSTGMKITLNSALSVAVTSNSRYSIATPTVNQYGRISGIFTIPEDSLLKFRTGERLFTITDASTATDQDAEMRSTAKYVAAGLLNRTQELRITPIVQVPPPPAPTPPPIVQPPTPVIPRLRRDPVAQTFFTPKPKSQKQNYGIFVSSVDLFFKSKPSLSIGAPQLPVTVRLVKTANGFPTQDVLASATVYPASVNTTNGIDVLPDSTNSSTYTRFTFGDPVYLEASSEYALVVASESPDYEVWISELGQNILGTNRRVSEQPYAGSFFRSQNASTWTPFQNQDLMFVVNKAVFTTSPATLTYSIQPATANSYADEILVHASDVTFPVANVSYFAKTTLASDLSKDAAYFQITPNELYKFGKDLKNSSKNNNRRRIIQAGDKNTLNVQVSLLTTDSDVSPIFNAERLSVVAIENQINAGSLTSNNVTITNGGGQHSTNTGIVVTVSAPQLANGTTATAVVLNSQIVGGNITGVYVTSAGSGYVEAPTITITDTAVASPYANATAVVAGENSNYGGNAKARYITRKITLADGFDAGDLRLYLRAARPQGTNVVAYYKVLSTEDPANFFDKKWQRLNLVKDLYSPDQDTTVELQYRPSTNSGKLAYTENGVIYPLGGKFKQFAIKLVLLADDPSVVPYVKNMRVIATPEG